MRQWPTIALACGAVACTIVYVGRRREAESRLYLFDEDPVSGELTIVGAPTIWPWWLAAVVLAVAAAVAFTLRRRA